MKKNLFIALEGIDGSGKSAQARLLAARLEAAGHKVYTTFEPTGRHVGKLLRSILKGEIKADEKVIAGLFLSDRLDHLLNEEDGLLGKLKDGYTVITDRYYFSSYAYHGTHMDMDWVINCNSMCADLLRPDLNIFINVSPQVSMTRIAAGRQGTERYETLENLEKVRAKYLEAFEKEAVHERITFIDGDRSIDEIATDIFNAVEAL